MLMGFILVASVACQAPIFLSMTFPQCLQRRAMDRIGRRSQASMNGIPFEITSHSCLWKFPTMKRYIEPSMFSFLESYSKRVWGLSSLDLIRVAPMSVREAKNNPVGFHIINVDFLNILSVLLTGVLCERQTLHGCRLEGITTEATTVGNGITKFDGFHAFYSMGLPWLVKPRFARYLIFCITHRSRGLKRLSSYSKTLVNSEVIFVIFVGPESPIVGHSKQLAIVVVEASDTMALGVNLF